MASLALALAAAACSSGTSAMPGQDPFPGDEWPTSTPEAEGLDPAAIDALVADIDAGRYGLIDHFLLIRNGHVVADRSWDHSGRYRELLVQRITWELNPGRKSCNYLQGCTICVSCRWIGHYWTEPREREKRD